MLKFAGWLSLRASLVGGWLKHIIWIDRRGLRQRSTNHLLSDNPDRLCVSDVRTPQTSGGTETHNKGLDSAARVRLGGAVVHVGSEGGVRRLMTASEHDAFIARSEECLLNIQLVAAIGGDASALVNECLELCQHPRGLDAACG